MSGHQLRNFETQRVCNHFFLEPGSKVLALLGRQCGMGEGYDREIWEQSSRQRYLVNGSKVFGKIMGKFKTHEERQAKKMRRREQIQRQRIENAKNDADPISFMAAMKKRLFGERK